LEFHAIDFVERDIQLISVMPLPITVSIDLEGKSELSIDEMAHFTNVIQEAEDALQISCIRPVRFFDSMNSTSVPQVFAFESPGLLGIGGKVWDSSFVLIAYLNRFRSDLVDQKRILELGSGTGVTGNLWILFF
jgi:hypothetical protein